MDVPAHIAFPPELLIEVGAVGIFSTVIVCTAHAET
jgi:hypothetical protein